MRIDKWNEEGRDWEEDHGLLDDGAGREVRAGGCRRAASARRFRRGWSRTASTCRSPQTEQAAAGRGAHSRSSPEQASKKLGMDRRQLSDRAPAAWRRRLLAMNEVFGRFFDVDPIEMFEPAAYAQARAPRDLFVFDDQLHLVRGSRPSPARHCARIAQGPTSAPTFKSNPFNPRGRATSTAKPGACGIRRSSVCR